ARLVGGTTTHELEQRVAPQRISVVLVFVAAGDLQEALADQQRQGMAHRPAAPVVELRCQGVGEAELVVCAGGPEQAAIRGELAGVKGQRQRGGERGCAPCARIGHVRTSWCWGVDYATRP